MSTTTIYTKDSVSLHILLADNHRSFVYSEESLSRYRAMNHCIEQLAKVQQILPEPKDQVFEQNLRVKPECGLILKHRQGRGGGEERSCPRQVLIRLSAIKAAMRYFYLELQLQLDLEIEWPWACHHRNNHP